jgi:predicted metal-binding protein
MKKRLIIMVRKVVEHVPEEQLKKDLENYRQRSRELGATDAKIITMDQVIIDERVRAKCIYPKCMFYGTNAHCPPHAMDPDEARKIVKKFRYGIFIRLQVPSGDFAGPTVTEKNSSARGLVKLSNIVTKIESEAFYDAYHLAMGFAGGPCKHLFCLKKECSALVPGQPCRHALRARGCMEGVGMDVFTMAAKVGWDVYPIGASVDPAEVPCGGAY